MTAPAPEQGEPFVTVVATIGRHPFRFLYDPRPLWRLLRAPRFDVIDIHEEPASLAAAEFLLLRWAARHQRGAVVFYSAENVVKRYPPPFRWIERWALRTADGVHTCNGQAADIMRSKGLRGATINLGLGVDVELFSPPECPLPDRPFRIGYFGRLTRRKGLPVLLEALAGLPDDVELHVHGDGPDRAAFEELATALGVAARVTFHGHTGGAALANAYRSVHVAAVPSQTTPRWTEQFGRVVVEAMASGLPVVGSDSGSIPELIGDAGIVVPEADVVAWRTALLELATCPRRRMALSDAARSRAQRWSWANVADAHYEFYRQVAP